ncbi:MAG: hypothetical protein M3O30_13090 [Planctomycetota bacterium]|nr:hypothetical protein [Planctomycetota bacterium]
MVKRKPVRVEVSTVKRSVEAKTKLPVKRVVEAARRDGDNGGVENLDKVRDILFGSQLRDTERRFGRVEERVVKETTDLREEMRKRMESLEAFLRKETQSVLERLKTEQSQRIEAVKEVAVELKETTKSVQLRATELQETIAEAQRELRQEILDQSKALRDELQLARADVTAELDRTAGELRLQKLDKAALSDLLTEMAARLSEQAE